jgi:predicted kinase
MPQPALRPFIVVSGLPASGKTTLAAHLASHLALPLLDKDDILEALFTGAGEVDPPARQRLSRMSDAVLARIAAASQGAVLVSFWRHEGEAGTAGTPVAWLRALSAALVEVHCLCPPALAEQRFRARTRHPGHNDLARLPGLPAQFQAVAQRGPLGLGALVAVRTDAAYDEAEIAAQVRRAIQPGG